jgi:uncharacterized protein YfbU (UPF0304 family)
MEFTDKERVFLIRQCNILEFLDADEKEYWQRAAEVFEHGYRQYYSEYLPHLEEPLSPEVYHLVDEILDVYDSIETYKEAHADDTEVAERWNSTFPGFSGNTEGEYHALVLFLQRTNRYSYVLKSSAELNSHSEMIPQYQKMIGVWKTYENKAILSRDEILALLNS